MTQIPLRRFRATLAASVLALAALVGTSPTVWAAVGDAPMVSGSDAPGSFALAAPGAAAPLWDSSNDWPGVRRAAGDLQADVERVTGSKPALATGDPRAGPVAVLIGTVGRSTLIDSLVASGKIDAAEIRGKWESFLIQVVDDPLPGVARALVIAGSDKRGTIYGIYEMSQQIGVSPWFWWADVPVRRRAALYVPAVRRVVQSPAVRYRGIFLNDEAPALSGWSKRTFGGFNHFFYERVFELLLRLRANYLWPAMWDNAFNEDDPENARLADEYGIVMGTSHHEPMLRAQQEWKRHGTGPWDYASNGEELRRFWTEGIRRNRNFESIVTIGMRGDGDVPMSPESNIALLQRIVADQRDILAREMNRDVTKIPQLWALYKEVQGYFEKGMRVPDDVTLLWCDDNWGNLRRLPTPIERTRPGGAGIYYHFDYVGLPRSYKWLNTNPITKVWEQLHLAWQYDANRIWIVNVGDLKPMEFPIEFFLSYAWDPARWPAERLKDYGPLWAAREFGTANPSEVAALIAAYTKLNGACKPEDVSPDTFSLLNYGEADRTVERWNGLIDREEQLKAQIPAQARDAYFELVEQPIKASAIVTEMQVAAAHNRLAAVQGRASANAWEARVRQLFADDAALTRQWDALAGGKWIHMMDQTHLGYTTWQQPVRNAMPAVTELQLPAAPEMAVAVEGSPFAWPTDNPSVPDPVLPAMSPYGRPTASVEVFNRGGGTVDFSVAASVAWVRANPAKGRTGTERPVQITVDWAAAPEGKSRPWITVTSPQGQTVRVALPLSKIPAPTAGFVEADGCVAIEAPHFDRAVNTLGITWTVLDDFGRTLGGVTPFPVTAASTTPGGDCPRLEYDVNLVTGGPVKVEVTLAPSLNFIPGHGLRFAVSLDDEIPHVHEVVARAGDDEAWARSVLDGARTVNSMHDGGAPGHHVLKLWRIDPGVVLERIVIDTGGVRPSYLGPPESAHVRLNPSVTPGS